MTNKRDILMIAVKKDVYSKMQELAQHQGKSVEDMCDEILVMALGYPSRAKAESKTNEQDK